MSNSKGDNVVPIDAAQSERKKKKEGQVSMSATLARLPTPMHRVRDRAQQQLKAAMQVLFDHVDDALFELADRAATNLEQNLYFESMREVRIHRRQMESDFTLGIDRNFEALIDPDVAVAPKEQPSSQLTDFSLVEKDELEELVAVDTLVNKVTNRCEKPLQLLSSRIHSLVNVAVTNRNNPLAPRLLADIFAGSARSLKVDIKAKLVLFKLFERHVMVELPQLLERANKLLADLGVAAPASRRIPPVAESPSPQQPSTPVASNAAAQGNQGLLQTLQTLLAPNEAPVSEQGVAEVQSDTQIMINALSQLQHQIDPAAVAATPTLLTHAQIQQSMRELTGKNPIDGQSQDVIKLVDMLFEFILEDGNLPDPMKVLLSRLQIPIIKVAITDPGFFHKGGHPARRLLNEMATAALGWVDDGKRRDPLYRKITKTIERVLNEFDSNIEIFSELLTDFVLFTEKERRRASILEQRIIDAEDSKAKTDIGRQQVSEELTTVVTEIFGDEPIPMVVNELLRGPWANLMFLIYMRQGKESEQWQKAVTTARNLVWSVSPVEDGQHRRKLLQGLPLLLKNLRMGLESISFNPSEQASLLERLEHIHLQLLSQSRPPAAETDSAKLRADDKKQAPGPAASGHSLTPDTSDSRKDNVLGQSDIELDAEDLLAAIDEPSFVDSDALAGNESSFADIEAQILEQQRASEEHKKDAESAPDNAQIADVVNPPSAEFDQPNTTENTSTHLSEEPLAGLDKEPLAVVNKEPSATVNEEPSAAANEESSTVVNEESSVAVNEEPLADINKEPSAEVNQKPLADINEEPSAAVNQKSSAATEKESLDQQPIEKTPVESEQTVAANPVSAYKAPTVAEQRKEAVEKPSIAATAVDQYKTAPPVDKVSAADKSTDIDLHKEVEQVEASEEPAIQTLDNSAASPMEQESPEKVSQQQPAAEVQKEPDEPPAIAETYMQRVDALSVGMWFEKQEDASSYRCRLASIIRATGKYIFVNRSGAKVAEETRESLALALQQRNLRILEDSMLFDRALESVITNLRTSRGR